MYKSNFIIYLFLGISIYAKSQPLTMMDSSIIIKSIIELDSNKIRFGKRVSCIPKNILNTIKGTKKVFKITDNAEKYTNDIYIGKKKINRLLKYIIISKDFIILTYKFGGFVTNSRLFYITLVNGKVDKIFNFIIPEHDNVSSLIHIFQVPMFELKNFDSYYW